MKRALAEEAHEIYSTLDTIYPPIRTSLKHEDPFELLISTILSAQSTDAQVNRLTPKLFQRFRDARSMSKASKKELEKLVHSSGYFHVKAKRIRDVSAALVKKFGGSVPGSMEELLTLPGVGRKTANIVLNVSFGMVEGIAVDTHVFRVSRRLGLASSKTPEKVEQELMNVFPKEYWSRVSMLLILHGRAICHARDPLCEKCAISSLCLYYSQIPLKEN